jgi:hypothetical protein
MLGRALNADANTRRRVIYEFDVTRRRYTGRTFRYRTEAVSTTVEDLVPFGPQRFLAIERDDKQGSAAELKRVFSIDLQERDRSGFLVKRPVLDLLRIRDPANISLPARTGDIGLGNPFAMPFISTEAVWALSDTRLLLVDDNNFPFTAGRNPGRPDDSEFVIVTVPPTRLPPAEGVVQRAWMSLAGRSAVVTRVRATASLQANFLFRAQPRAGSRLRVTWFHDGRRAVTIPKPRAQLVTSTLFSQPRLSPGAYRAVLFVQAPGAKIRAVASARARVG